MLTGRFLFFLLVATRGLDFGEVEIGEKLGRRLLAVGETQLVGVD